MIFEENYWSGRYKQGNTQWDVGYVSTPIKEYIDQLENKKQKILIPGSGNAYEAAYLHQLDFENVYIVDIAKEPIEDFISKNPSFPAKNALHQDFFSLEDKFDLIVEQTFFCALHPSQRPEYVAKVSDLLNEGGKLVGLLFDIPLNSDQPPFGGNQEVYRPLFESHFTITKMEKCYNSITPRTGKELFIHFVKK